MPEFILSPAHQTHLPFRPSSLSTLGVLTKPDGGAVVVRGVGGGSSVDLLMQNLGADGVLDTSTITLSSGMDFVGKPYLQYLTNGTLAVAWSDVPNAFLALTTKVLAIFDPDGQELARWSMDMEGERIVSLLPRQDGGVSIVTQSDGILDGVYGTYFIQRDFTELAVSHGPARVLSQTRPENPQTGDILPLADGGYALLVDVARIDAPHYAQLFLHNADGSLRLPALTVAVGQVSGTAQALALPSGDIVLLWALEGGPNGSMQMQRFGPDGTALTPVVDFRVELTQPFSQMIDLVMLSPDRYGAIFSVSRGHWNGQERFDVLLQDLTVDLRPLNVPQLIARDARLPIFAGLDSDDISRLHLVWEEGYGNRVRMWASTFDTATVTEGTMGDDNLGTMAAPGIVYLLDGNDEIRGSLGNDMIAGHAGNDTIRSGGGQDTLAGNDGNDFIMGSWNGSDLIFGGAGHDALIGAQGFDTIYGGAGGDKIFGGDHDDWLYGDEGNDEIHGDAGHDWIDGGYGADTLIGNDGRDALGGGPGSDLLFGGPDSDNLNGGYDNDRLNGGAGADRFIHGGQAVHGTDWVQDFRAAEGDRLVIWPAQGDRSDYQVNFATTPGAGSDDVAEAFVIYRPTGQILWALVDGAAQDSITLQLGAQVFDLLA